jgi:hypothetical protein
MGKDRPVMLLENIRACASPPRESKISCSGSLKADCPLAIKWGRKTNLEVLHEKRIDTSVKSMTKCGYQR